MIFSKFCQKLLTIICLNMHNSVPVFLFLHFRLEKPLTVMPGDSFVLKCTYQSRLKKERTFYGPAATDEMCGALIEYYPANTHYEICANSGKLEICNGEWAEPNNCNVSLVRQIIPEIVTKIMSKCDQTGVKCQPECKRLIQELKLENPCFNGDTLYYTEFITEDVITGGPKMAHIFRTAIRSCDLLN